MPTTHARKSQYIEAGRAAIARLRAADLNVRGGGRMGGGSFMSYSPASQRTNPRDLASVLRANRGWVYACADRIADAVAQVPLRLYANTQGRPLRSYTKARPIGRKRMAWLKANTATAARVSDADQIVEITEHPLLDLLRAVNAHNNEFGFQKLTVLYLALVGNAWWWPKYDGPLGTLSELWALPPAAIRPIIDGKTGRIAAWSYGYGNEKQTLSLDEVIHFHQPNPEDPSGLGMGPLQAVLVAANSLTAINETNRNLFDHGAMPAYALKVPADGMIRDKERDRMLLEFRRQYGGTGNVSKPVILTGGMELQALALSARDSQYPQATNLARTEIAAVFGVPESILKTEDVNRSNAEVGSRTFAQFTLLPYCRMIADQLNQDLVPLYDERLFLAHDNPVQEDRTAQRDDDMLALTHGLMTRNEIRQREGLPPAEGGDDLLVPSALKTIAQMQNPPTPPSFNPFGMPPAGAPPDEETDKPKPEAGPEKPDKPEKAATLHQAAQEKSSPAGAVWHPQMPSDFLEAILGAFREIQADVLTQMPAKSVKYATDPTGWLLGHNKWRRILQDTTEPYLRGLLAVGLNHGLEVLQEMGVTVGAGVSVAVDSPAISAALTDYTSRFAEVVGQTTWDTLHEGLQRGIEAGETIADLRNRVVDVMTGDAGRCRGEMIARTETARAVEQGQERAWRESGVVRGKRWLASPDACEFCLAVAQQFEAHSAALGAAFVPVGGTVAGVDGGSMDISYEAVQHPPLHTHCRCDIVPVILEIA